MNNFPTSDADRAWLNRIQTALATRGVGAEPFWKLYDLLRSKRLVKIALQHVLQNEGAKTAGIDGICKTDLDTAETQETLIHTITQELRAKAYRPKPVRRVYIPKPNGKLRPLGIPTIKDRVVEEMVRLILEPIYEGKFYAHSYGFRPYRSTQYAVSRLWSLHARFHFDWIVEGDIHACFDEIEHTHLVTILRKTIKDERLIRLIQAMLRAGIQENGETHYPTRGTPQGGIASPLLANIFLNELDQFIAAQYGHLAFYERKKSGATPMFIVRYADDFVIVTKSQYDAERVKRTVSEFLAQMGLELSLEKTRITHICQGYDFLGFTLRRYRQVTLITPSQKAVQRFKDKLRERVRLAFHKYGFTPEAVVCINQLIRGWGMYYCHVSASRAFRTLDHDIWWVIWRYLIRAKGGQKVQKRALYCQHYLPYAKSAQRKDRMHQGRAFGAWQDEQHTQAILVISLDHIYIEYLPFFKQRHAYLPKERETLIQTSRTILVDADPTLAIPIYTRAYGPGWQATRRKVLQRDHYHCVTCGNRNNLEVHHVVIKAGTDPKADDLNNLVTLCRSCHARITFKQSNESK